MNSLDIVGIRLVKDNTLLSEKRIRTPKDVIEILSNELQFLDREVMMSVNFNNKNQVINAHLVSMGSINASLVDPKNIFKTALLSNASNIMLLHNHPSGDCSPSKEDIEVTEIISKNCKMLGMNLLDHVIIGKNSYYSIKCDIMTEMEDMDLSSKNDDIEL